MTTPAVIVDRFGRHASERYRTVPEETVLASLLLGGWAFDLRTGRADAARQQARDGLRELVELGVGVALAPDGRRLFDPAELVNKMKWAGLAGRCGLWRDRWVATGRRL